jgi:hypothetical protein
VGWTGALCERDVDECAVSAPCHNQATCLNTDGAYACVCARGYEGKDCAVNTDDCADCEHSFHIHSKIPISTFILFSFYTFYAHTFISHTAVGRLKGISFRDTTILLMPVSCLF